MKKILILGGTGFVGSALAHRLSCPSDAPGGIRQPGAKAAITLPTRRRDRAKHLELLPHCRVVSADIHDPASLKRLMSGQDVVINLVGILRGDFQRVHVELPRRIAEAALACNVGRVIQVSALQAAADAPSAYLRSKAAGEAVLRQAGLAEAGLGLSIFRPSVIFGAGDAFLSLFARLAAMAPFFPLASADARFQPVWVNDVADAIALSLERQDAPVADYALCGPRQYSLRELVSYAAATAGHPCPVIGLPAVLGWLQAWAMEFIPNGPMTRDNILSMQRPSVCEAGCSLPFGLTATALEGVAPTYLRDGRARARNGIFRRRARR